MGDLGFDRFAKAVEVGTDRQRLLRAGLGGALLAALGRTGAAADHGCRHARLVCTKDSQCCSGDCLGNDTCRCTAARQCPPPGPCKRAVCTKTGRCAVRNGANGAACGEDKVCNRGQCVAAASLPFDSYFQDDDTPKWRAALNTSTGQFRICSGTQTWEGIGSAHQDSPCLRRWDYGEGDIHIQFTLSRCEAKEGGVHTDAQVVRHTWTNGSGTWYRAEDGRVVIDDPSTVSWPESWLVDLVDWNPRNDAQPNIC